MAPRDASVAAVAPVLEHFEINSADHRHHVVTLFKSAVLSSESQSEADSVRKTSSIELINEMKLLAKIQSGFAKTSSASVREGACVLFRELCTSVGQAVEPFVLPMIANLIELTAATEPSVVSAAHAAIASFMMVCSANCGKVLLATITPYFKEKESHFVKTAAMDILDKICAKAPVQMSLTLPTLVPLISALMWDSKLDVKKRARVVMTDICKLVNNKDIEKFIPALIACIADPKKVAETVHQLGATTFVQAVEPPTLAMMVPLLDRAMKERATPIKRKACVIIDNMCKLVVEPKDAALFLPKLAPSVERLKEEVADPEVRDIAARAYKTMIKAGQGLPIEKILELASRKIDINMVTNELKDEIKKVDSSIVIEGMFLEALHYSAELLAALMEIRQFCIEEWTACFIPYVGSFINASVSMTALKAYNVFAKERSDAELFKEDDDDEEGEVLCNCEFSLAYGGKILLNTASLKLKKGRRYGLCGPNGAGKSTLMRAIANDQLEGFPSPDELRTVYVEHDIDGELSDLHVVDFIMADKVLKTMTTREEVVSTLTELGFTDRMKNAPVGALSGGWKMKLALAKAMLRKAQIYLLDEPTNHLDVVNVKWLEDYLTGLTDVTSIVVSHDSKFLDNICTDIIHYEGLKLKTYHGNLSKFVEKKPEARSYYELASTQGLVFKFPEPGFLEGIKSKDRAILKMSNVDYTYPGTDRQILYNITLQCSLNSRVAVIGPNGAGKSTLIKVLTNNGECDKGTVWRHPNLRIAYVAQHAFHHIEQQLDKTPNEYIQWRFAGGDDAEELNKSGNLYTEEELKAMEATFSVDGVKRIVEKITSRRKQKNSYEYEVSWKGAKREDSTWLPRVRLIEMGFEKMLVEVDRKIAAEQGNLQRPLTRLAVEKHLNDVGLEPEFGTHSQMRGLSGGQKVKVVIAAAMWNNPHLLVLDEPTNYLDRESLGALAGAITEYGGGVLMISHNRQFTENLCNQVWAIDNGRLVVSGHDWTQSAGKEEFIVEKEQEAMVDAFGNTIEVNQKKKLTLTGKEKRAARKRKDQRIKAGLPVSDSEDDD